MPYKKKKKYPFIFFNTHEKKIYNPNKKLYNKKIIIIK